MPFTEGINNPEEVRMSAPQLSPGNMQEAEYWRSDYAVIAEIGTTPEHLLDPAYWAHHAFKMKPWDKIEVRAQDGTWYAEYIVLEASRTWAKVKQIIFVPLTTADVSLTQSQDMDAKRDNALTEALANHEVKWRGPKGWSVVRKSDHAALSEGHRLKTDAEGWLRNHVSGEIAKAREGAPVAV